MEDPIVDLILTRDNWMILVEMRPSDVFDDLEGDKNYNWPEQLLHYTKEQLSNMRDWIYCQKKIDKDSPTDDLPFGILII